MKLPAIEQSLTEYQDVFMEFRKSFEMPESWFKKPDHFAIKCANKPDYLETCDEFEFEVDENGLWEIDIDGRSLASAKLYGKVGLGGYDFSWVEIMQPRPGKELESGFVEHTEFLFADFFEVQRLLTIRGVDFELQENPGHSWINVLLDNSGKEIKFNDKLLADVTVLERANGTLHRMNEE